MINPARRASLTFVFFAFALFGCVRERSTQQGVPGDAGVQMRDASVSGASDSGRVVEAGKSAVDAQSPASPQDAGDSLDSGALETALACGTTSSMAAIEAWLSLGFREEPVGQNGPDVSEHVLTPSKRQVFEGSPQTTVFEGPTDRGTRGMLIFGSDKTLAPVDFVDKKLRVRRENRELSFCVHPGGSGTNAEQAVVAQLSLRDDMNELLWLSSAATPTGADGKIYSSEVIAPELTTRWLRDSDALCRTSGTVLEVTVTHTGKRFALGPGQRYRFESDGRAYIVAVSSVIGVAAGSAGECGVATWVVYRDGLLAPAH
ncbi:MAG: hypothetical protein RL701_4855 [Pseudomonadota bacterium]